MRQKCNGAKHSTEIMDSVVSWRVGCETAVRLQEQQQVSDPHFILLFVKPPSGRRAFPSAVKADCEVDWSDGKGECWDE